MPLRPQPNCQRTPSRPAATYAAASQPLPDRQELCSRKSTPPGNPRAASSPVWGNLDSIATQNRCQQAGETFFPTGPARQIREDISSPRDCQQAATKKSSRPNPPRQPAVPPRENLSIRVARRVVNNPHRNFSNSANGAGSSPSRPFCPNYIGRDGPGKHLKLKTVFSHPPGLGSPTTTPPSPPPAQPSIQPGIRVPQAPNDRFPALPFPGAKATRWSLGFG